VTIVVEEPSLRSTTFRSGRHRAPTGRQRAVPDGHRQTSRLTEHRELSAVRDLLDSDALDPRPRTAAALEARRRRTQAKLDQVRLAIADLNKRKVPVTVSAVVRRAGVSRTFLYENPEARELVSDVIGHATIAHNLARPCPDTPAETAWRERALNAEVALKIAHGETPKNVHSVIALGHEHHDRANLSVGGKPQLGRWS
jgi:uncharacterized protein DUF6262